MAVRVRHTFQTPLPNDPAKNVSANRWNEDHDVTGLGGMSIVDDAASDGNGYVRKNGLWARPANTDVTGLGGLATKDDAASDGFFYGRRNAAWVKGLIADTAANLASSNPTLLAGQIGFETDTLSFKIGDGVTAYNSLTYFYRGLPVSGESSLGTPHVTSDANRIATLVVNTATNTAGVWSAAVTMTGVPVGAKAAWCFCLVALGGAAAALAVEAATGYTLSDISTGTNLWKYWALGEENVAGMSVKGMLKIHLDANRQFKWCTTLTNSTVKIGSAIDYEM